MPRFREVKNNYSSGELDPKMLGRVDNKHYFNGAEVMRNVLSLPQGGWRVRPGLEYCAEIVGLDFRAIPFQKSIDQAYLVVLTTGAFHIFKAGALQVSVTGQPWLVDDLAELTWTQSLDTLLIFHDRFRPRAIQRQGDDVTWGAFQWVLKNVPRFDFGDTAYSNGVDEVQSVAFDGESWADGDPFTLSLGGEETSTIEYSPVAATLAANIQTALRDLSITSATGITAAGGTGFGILTIDVTLGGDEGGRPWGAMAAVVKAPALQYQDVDLIKTQQRYITVTVETKGDYPGEDVWSDARGWPGCGVFWQGRLWMAGSRSRPKTVWGSRAGDEEDFNSKENAPDYGINATADGEDVPRIHQVFVGRHLQFFASTAEFYVPKSESEPITPANFSLRRTTARGCKRGVPVFDNEGGTIFVQASREADTFGYRAGVTLREFIFSDGEQAYQANNMSLLASHLIRDPVRVAVRRATTIDDCDYDLLVNADGTMTWFCTLRAQEVNAFTLALTDGKFLDVGVVGETIYVVVERTVQGTIKRFLERFVDGLYVDSGKTGGAASSVAVPHLAGETVSLRLDGNWQQDQVVPLTGTLTFPRASATSYQVGLPWPVVDEATSYVYCVADLPIAADLADGPVMGRKRRIVELTVNLLETETLVVNGNRIIGRQFGDGLLDQPVSAITGERRKRGLSGWNNGGRVKIGDTRPGPVTVLALAKSVGV